MSNKIKVVFMLFVIVVVTIACGSSDEVTVKPGGSDSNGTQPTEAVKEEEPVGTVRSNPAPKGYVITADNMDFEILETIRPADEIVMAGNQFNTKPEEGYQYLFIKLQVKCNKSTDDTCSVSPFNFEMIGDEGIIYSAEWMLAGVEGMLETKEFYGGATVSGYVAFVVKASDSALVFTYDPLLGDNFYMRVE